MLRQTKHLCHISRDIGRSAGSPIGHIHATRLRHLAISRVEDSALWLASVEQRWGKNIFLSIGAAHPYLSAQIRPPLCFRGRGNANGVGE